VVELLLGVTGLIPAERSATVMREGVSWNYTAWLSIVLLISAGVLVTRFLRTVGAGMLRMMGTSPNQGRPSVTPVRLPATHLSTRLDRD
jgi:hypothetical protein